MRKWVNTNYTFKSKKWGELNYWIERGWNEEDALLELSKRNSEIKKRNRLCKEYWIKKGYSEEDSIKKISLEQKKSAKCVKVRQGKSKKMLKEKGYTDEEIRMICLTPSNKQFWIKKGFSELESLNKVRENQINAAKQVDCSKRLLPTNIEYWINRGYSEEDSLKKVSERQSTFTLKKCVEKYGEEKGKDMFTKRQEKWLKSLSSGGNLKIGFSKISQEVFYKLLEQYPISERNNLFFATHNKEFTLNKKNGGVWLYDFTDTKNKKIIEFNGDMYHGNPKKYSGDDNPHPFRKDITAQDIWDKDKKKIDVAIENGFKVLVIWDSEYRWGNKEEVIKKCLQFLFDK
jgi:uncharacterized protein YaeQ